MLPNSSILGSLGNDLLVPMLLKGYKGGAFSSIFLVMFWSLSLDLDPLSLCLRRLVFLSLKILALYDLSVWGSEYFLKIKLPLFIYFFASNKLKN